MRHFACGLIIGSVLLATAGESDAESPAPVLTAPGLIEPVGVVPLGSAVTGVVSTVHVRDGDRVRAGQLLVDIDCRVLEAQAKVRDRELAVATAVLSRTRNGYRVEEIAIAAAAVKGAEANAEEAQIARQRAVALRVDNTATQARIDVAERDARATAAALEEARQRLAMLRAGSRAEDIEEATARRDTAAAELEETRGRLEQCSIRAPVDGRVMSVAVEPGQFVSDLNQVPLVNLIDDTRVRVRAEVEEADRPKLCEDQRASVTEDGRGEHNSGAGVLRITAQPAKRSLPKPAATDTEGEVRTVYLTLDTGRAGWTINRAVTVRFEPCGPPDKTPP